MNKIEPTFADDFGDISTLNKKIEPTFSLNELESSSIVGATTGMKYDRVSPR